MPHSHTGARPKKYFQKYKAPLAEFPNLLEMQVRSFQDLVKKGLGEVFKEFSPIPDYSGKKFELEFTSFSLGEPKCDEFYAKENKLSYEAPLKVNVKLTNKLMGGSKEQEIFLSDLPMMTAHGTFIINGVERVIVPQLARSFGIFFTENELKGKRFFGAKIIPARGVWIEIDAETDGVIYVRIDKKRKFPVTALLRSFGMVTDDEIKNAFTDHELAHSVVELCLAKDTAKTVPEAHIEIYKRLRDGDLATADNAREFITALFSKDRYDLSPVGRFRFNKRFDLDMGEKELERRTIQRRSH